MTEESQRRWDIIIKVVGLLGSAVAIFAYFDKRELDFRKPFWDEQLKLYFEATDTVSKVANLPAGPDRDKAIARYWELSYGSLRVLRTMKMYQRPWLHSVPASLGIAIRPRFKTFP